MIEGEFIMYFDNATTSYPKPQVIKQAVIDFFNEENGSFQRTDTENSDFIFKTREKIARLLNDESPSNIVFTSNSTESLNMIIQGFLKKGNHVIMTATGHNSVIRPLIRLRKEKMIKISWIDSLGYIVFLNGFGYEQ